VCRIGTVRAWVLLAALAAAGSVWGQPQPDWRRIGGSSAELALASPATGPVSRVWFSESGSVLFAATASGEVFQTADYEAWLPAPGAVPPPAPGLAAAARKPEPDSSVVASSTGASALFALGRNLYRSEDGGRSWSNLTAFKSRSVIGSGQRSVAVSPADFDQIVVANDFGVWRSVDGGLTWDGLNGTFPGLPVRRILSTPAGASGARIQVENWAQPLELPPGGRLWAPAANPVAETEQELNERFSRLLGARITASAVAGDAAYAGASDGRIWSSGDGGATFRLSQAAMGVSGPVMRIFADPAAPRAALAALGGAGVHVLRTFNGGEFWDAMDSNLPAAPARSVAADLQSGAVYVATAEGVFWTATDLAVAGAPPRWTSLSGLPSNSVFDVKLDKAGVQLYVAVEGYGVFAAQAPHLRGSLRVISAADFSARAAAPGSLLTVAGARISAARGGGLDYPVLGAPSDDESQIQTPFGASGPRVALSLQTSAGPVTLWLQVQPASPAIFVDRTGAPMLYDADTGLPVNGANPAHSGGRLQIFASGLGQVRPELPAGVPTPLDGAPHAVAAPVRVFLDGAPIQVARAILAPGYVGFYLIEAQLPLIANFGSAQLYVETGGQESNRVQFVIEP
jgi:uncharacterized protein (TIGR03437 family)